MFQQPSQGGDKVPFTELVKSLALFVVREHRTGVTTVHGEKDAVAADVHILDGPKAGTVYDNSLIFQGALIGSLKGAAGGEPVLARIDQGAPKPGQNPPFILVPFTQADLPVATQYWQAWQARQFSQPAAQAPAATSPAAGPTPAAAPAAVATAPVATAPVPSAPPAANGGMTAEAFRALPLEVQELLRQSGQAPAGV